MRVGGRVARNHSMHVVETHLAHLATAEERDARLGGGSPDQGRLERAESESTDHNVRGRTSLFANEAVGTSEVLLFLVAEM
jgi:hypothetical protein